MKSHLLAVSLFSQFSLFHPAQARLGAIQRQSITAGKSGGAFQTDATTQLQVKSTSGEEVRLGSNTAAKKDGKVPSYDLTEGVMMLSAAGDKTASVRVNEGRADIKGATIMVETKAAKYMKIACLEGVATIRLGSKIGVETKSIKAGQLLIINFKEKFLPEPASFDIQRLVSTSDLLNGWGGIPDVGGINSAISQQKVAFSGR